MNWLASLWQKMFPPRKPAAAPVLGWHKVTASSFADPADIAAFRRCKQHGGSDAQCFKLGDNGVGCWDDDVSAASHIAYCALPPDDMIARWGSVDAARHKRVVVTANGRLVVCILGDRMPWHRNIKNGCGIDLNPVACAALGLEPPVKTPASWAWEEGEA